MSASNIQLFLDLAKFDNKILPVLTFIHFKFLFLYKGAFWGAIVFSIFVLSICLNSRT